MGMFMKLEGIPEPPSGYVPPLGSSRNTWTNIYKNKGRIDYCVQQFGVSVSCPFLLFAGPHCPSSKRRKQQMSKSVGLQRERVMEIEKCRRPQLISIFHIVPSC